MSWSLQQIDAATVFQKHEVEPSNVLFVSGEECAVRRSIPAKSGVSAARREIGMRWVEVEDAAGRPLKITLLSDWDLIFCVPFALLSFLFRSAFRISFAPVDAAVGLSYQIFTKAGLSLTGCLVSLPCLIAAASWVTAVTGPFSVASLISGAIVFLLAGTVFAKINGQFIHLEDPHGRIPPSPPVSRSDVATFDRIRREAASLPDACVRHRYDKGFLYCAWLRALLFLPAFVCELFLPTSWLRYALLLFVVVFALNDFERIEHVSSHSSHGRMLIAGNAPWWASVAESLRRNLVWPLFGWFPNWYYVVHALHHHVENNSPADWQSTVRYSRASVLDFTKATTWLSLNGLIPLETFFYMAQRRGWRFFRILARGWLWYPVLIAAVMLVQPLAALILIALRATSGIGIYRFVGTWHGFHDPTRPYDPAASNHALAHYAHHVSPRIHLRDGEALVAVVREIREPSAVVVLRPEFGMRGFWHLQGLLWKREFARAAESLIQHKNITENDRANPFILRRGVTAPGIDSATMQRLSSAFYSCLRPRWLRAIDASLSNLVGTLVCRRYPSPALKSVLPVEESS